MNAVKAPPKFGLDELVVEGPIKSFPEDVGWFTSYRRPLEVHARKMGRDFVVRRDGEEDERGHAGDYLVVMNDGTPVLIPSSTFDERYDREAPTKVVEQPPLPDQPMTVEQKATLEAAVATLVQKSELELKKTVEGMAENARSFMNTLTTQQGLVREALDLRATAPSVYACPFCIIQGLKREEIRDHVLRDHLMHGLFGDLDKR